MNERSRSLAATAALAVVATAGRAATDERRAPPAPAPVATEALLETDDPGPMAGTARVKPETRPAPSWESAIRPEMRLRCAPRWERAPEERTRVRYVP